jgi:hypothetical protein
MSEYIEREALMEELAAIQSATYMSTCLTEDECKGKRRMIARAIDAVKAAPAAAVAEVVHCGDCKFRCDFMDGHCECRRWPNIPMSYQGVDPQFDFCSYGERKEATQ